MANKRPSAGLSKVARSRVAKRAKSGKNVGKGNFNEVAAKATKKYKSKKIGRKVAASAMWKAARKRGVTKRGTIKKKK